MSSPFGRAIRPEFALAEDAIFLNHGSYGAPPRPVLAAQNRWRERMEAQPLEFLARQLLMLLDGPRAQLAELIGARARDIAFMNNATTGLNCVARSLRLEAGDRVLITGEAHPGCHRPMAHVCAERGAVLDRVPVPYPMTDPEAFIDAVAQALTPRTKLAVFAHIGTGTAMVMPIAGAGGLVALCRERGVPVLIDGAHAPGQLDLDLASLGADYYAGNCHKWLFAPRGCGFLWVAERNQATLDHALVTDVYARPPWRASGDPEDYRFPDRMHWVGTRDPTAWLALSDAFEWLEGVGPDAVKAYNRALADEAAALLIDRLPMPPEWRAGVPLPEPMRTAMVTLPLPLTLDPADESAGWRLNCRLWEEHRIEVPIIGYQGRYWFRISAQVYNSIDQYEKLADVLVELGA